jgi:alpha-1,2-mannosyltransferase
VTAAPAPARRTSIRAPAQWRRRLAGALETIDRYAIVSMLAGLCLLGLLSWYVAWHVPTSNWLFTSNYAVGFKDLTYRIQNVESVRHLGVLYYAQIDRLQYFVYPPAALWIFWPLTWVGLFTGEILWTLASLLALAWLIASAARFACRWRWQKAWAVSLLAATPLSTLVLQPVGVHLALGQVGLFLAAAATFDILCVRNRCRGFLTGVTAALKLYPIVYFAIFALRREWRALGNAVAGLVATTAVAWIVFPSYSATYFFHRLIGGNELRHYWGNAHWLSSSSSVYTFFFRQPFTGSPSERDAGLALCVAVLAFGVYAAWRQLQEGREAGALLCVALASTIGSPVAWDHYFFWVVLVPFVLVERGRLEWFRTTALSLFLLACLVPFRLARNESLSHRDYGGTFIVIFISRNALIAVSLLWLAAAVLPWTRRGTAQSSAATIESHQLRSAG